MKIRPAVAEFAEAMEKILRKNDHKGTNIRDVDPSVCLERLWEELRELDRVAYGHPNITTTRKAIEEMQKEAIDVANFAAMYWLSLESWKKEIKK